MARRLLRRARKRVADGLGGPPTTAWRLCRKRRAPYGPLAPIAPTGPITTPTGCCGGNGGRQDAAGVGWGRRGRKGSKEAQGAQGGPALGRDAGRHALLHGIMGARGRDVACRGRGTRRVHGGPNAWNLVTRGEAFGQRRLPCAARGSAVFWINWRDNDAGRVMAARALVSDQSLRIIQRGNADDLGHPCSASRTRRKIISHRSLLS
jgi:hypothetical protein